MRLSLLITFLCISSTLSQAAKILPDKFWANAAGDWGGSCTCPNGSVYWVGDENNSCKSLACKGGKSGACSRHKDRKWANNKVECAPKWPGNVKGSDKIIEGAHDSGQFGGLCTCPGGGKYWVGDNKNSCKSLACVGGTSHGCEHQRLQKYQGRKVICGKKSTPKPKPKPTPKPKKPTPKPTKRTPGGGWYSNPKDWPTLKSGKAQYPITIWWNNIADRPVKIYKMLENGKWQWENTPSPKKMFSRRSFNNHVWKVTYENGKTIGYYMDKSLPAGSEVKVTLYVIDGKVKARLRMRRA